MVLLVAGDSHRQQPYGYVHKWAACPALLSKATVAVATIAVVPRMMCYHPGNCLCCVICDTTWLWSARHAWYSSLTCASHGSLSAKVMDSVTASSLLRRWASMCATRPTLSTMPEPCPQTPAVSCDAGSHATQQRQVQSSHSLLACFIAALRHVGHDCTDG